MRRSVYEYGYEQIVSRYALGRQHYATLRAISERVCVCGGGSVLKYVNFMARLSRSLPSPSLRSPLFSSSPLPPLVCWVCLFQRNGGTYDDSMFIWSESTQYNESFALPMVDRFWDDLVGERVRAWVGG